MAEHVSKTAGNRTLQAGLMLPGLVLLMLATTTLVFAETLLDPTRPPATLGLSQEGNASVPATGPVLQSVLIAPGRKVAIISGQTVKLGEKFGDSRVVSITESEVILRSGKVSKTLKLFPDVQKRLTSSSVRPQVYMRRQ